MDLGGLSVSRDGTKAAYTSEGRVIVRDMRTGQAIDVAAGESPSVSPDGSFLVYTLKKDDIASLYKVSTSGGSSRKLCEGCAYWGARGFSSDGSGVLVQSYNLANEIDHIDMVNTTTGMVNVTLSHPERSLWHAAFSWDDKWMTFKLQLEEHGPDPKHFRPYITRARDRDIVPAPQSEWIPLTSGEYGDGRARLSPDGNILYFTSDRDGHNCFWAQRLNPKTKHPQGPRSPSSIFTTTSPATFETASPAWSST